MATGKLSKEFIVKSYEKSDSPAVPGNGAVSVSLPIETFSGYKVVAATPFFQSAYGGLKFVNSIGVESPAWDLYLFNASSAAVTANRRYGVTVVYQKI